MHKLPIKCKFIVKDQASEKDGEANES